MGAEVNATLQPIIWRNVIKLALLHSIALYGLTLVVRVKCATIWWNTLLVYLSTLGVQAGVHRLWSHRSYKACTGLRAFLAACFTLAWQTSIHDWCRDHRVHHKFSETDADPHDARRGT